MYTHERAHAPFPRLQDEIAKITRLTGIPFYRTLYGTACVCIYIYFFFGGVLCWVFIGPCMELHVCVCVCVCVYIYIYIYFGGGAVLSLYRTLYGTACVCIYIFWGGGCVGSLLWAGFSSCGAWA